MPIVSFGDKGTEDVFHGRNTAEARRTLPQELWPIAQRKLDKIQAAAGLKDLRIPPGNRLKALKGDRTEWYSIRINQQYRICFRWTPQGAEEVEIVDYHK